MDAQTALCTRDPKTVSRWATSDPQDADQTDPGPWRDGEFAECPGCGVTVAVTHRVTNQRTAGTQYVGTLAAH